MATARRQYRSAPSRYKPATTRGVQACLAALYSDTSITPERAAALQRELSAVPYRKPPQGELALLPGAPEA